MSIHGEKSQGVELSEQIESLQEELTSLNEQLKSQTDDTERERLEMLIGDIHGEIEILKVTVVEPTSITSQTIGGKEIFKRENANP